ncbi:MAG: cytochrome ubiquinol oxidase subunit I [Armatimonadota bacterium]
MDGLLAARLQMTVSLAFHMIFAALGIGLPLLLVMAEGLWLRTGRAEYLALARKWSKALGVLFAVGAVSGTALAFELGLLWPHFMQFAGPIIGSAFALEGYAFFIEAIFIGLYLYGWDRLSPRAHWLCGIPIAISGAVSGILVVSANAWMQHPVGFELVDGKAENIQPFAALFSPAWAVMALHSTLSCYTATAFAVAGVYAWGYWKGHRTEVQRAGLRLSMALGAVMALLMPLSGDLSAGFVAETQPTKLAAMEAQFETERGAAFRIGGWPDEERGEVSYVLEIPKLLSFLAFRDFDAEVKGLNEFPRSEWPNVTITHLSFQVMVGCGMALILVSGIYWLLYWRRRGELPGWAAAILVPAGTLGFLALETGWMVTEVGRQPWVIRDVMRTSEAVSPSPHLVNTFYSFTVLYLFLAVVLTWFLLRLGQQPQEPEPDEPAAAHGRASHAA